MNIQTAAQSTWQAGSKGASDAFNRFVEGDDNKNLAYGEDSYKGDPDKKDFWDSFAAAGENRVQQQQQEQKKKQEPERKDFWDEFASIGESKTNAQQGGGMFGTLAGGAGATKSKSSIGTTAMKKPSSGPAAKGGGGEDGWEEW